MIKNDFLALHHLLNKKYTVYSIIIFLITIISTIILIFSANVGKILDNGLKSNIGFRTLIVSERLEPGLSQSENLQKDKNNLLSIDHVVDAFESKYQEVVIDESSLANEKLDGTMTLFIGTKNTRPTLIKGEYFGEEESDVVICPTKFYPTYNPTLVNKKEIIDGNILIGKTFIITYYDYIEDMEGLKKNQSYQKELKVVGTYDAAEKMNDNGTCYTSPVTMKEISDTVNSWMVPKNQSTNVSISYGLNVIVDEIDNVESVIRSIEELGFSITGTASRVDTGLLNTIKLSTFAIIFLVLFSATGITLLFVKKNLLKDEYDISILRTSGYSKLYISNLYAYKYLINNLLIYFSTQICLLFAIYILIEKVPFLVGIDLMIGGIAIGFMPFVFAFAAAVLLPVFVIYASILLKSNIELITSLKKEY